MSRIERMVLVVGAAVCVAAALLILAWVGLPERAQFTGRLIEGERPVAPEIDAMAPPFQTMRVEGSPFRLDETRGQVVVLNFWATWCEPCRVEMPVLQALSDRYGTRGLRVIGVNLGETAGMIREWAGGYGVRYDLVLDELGQIAALYQIRGQPTTYVIAPSGVITQIFFGAADEAAFEAAIAPLLAR
ncbi:MAG: TlpA family protein disulfide reductase [Anaerolineae bacterium]|nr:TlpA family protein disulfide reductase [Anaerolineae bacterium]